MQSSLSKSDYFFAGSVSGFAARMAVQPLDVIKIRLQLQVEPIAISHANPAKYTGLVQSFRQIFSDEGLSAFWKGHIPAQIQAVSFTAIQFMSFEIISHQILSLIDKENKKLTSLSNFVAGCFAGTCAATITQPLDVLRTRFIAQGSERIYNNLYHGCKTIALEEGWRGFFRGLTPTLILISPQTGLQFGVYYACNSLLLELDSENRLNSGVQSLISGSIAGILAKIAVYPLDVAKKRLQVQGFEKARQHFGKMHVSKNLTDCIMVTIREEGWPALFKGLKPSLAKSCVSVGTRFCIYDQICHLIEQYKYSKNKQKSDILPIE